MLITCSRNIGDISLITRFVNMTLDKSIRGPPTITGRKNDSPSWRVGHLTNNKLQPKPSQSGTESGVIFRPHWAATAKTQHHILLLIDFCLVTHALIFIVMVLFSIRDDRYSIAVELLGNGCLGNDSGPWKLDLQERERERDRLKKGNNSPCGEEN